MVRPALTLVAAGFLALAAACSNTSGRYDLSGTVTFDGRPVPAGYVLINPDLSKKNDGPQGFAEIRNGRFDTRALAKGAPSGPVVLIIDGFDGNALPDGPEGKPLFVGYRIELDLPKASSEQTIEVPASAASVKKGSGPRP